MRLQPGQAAPAFTVTDFTGVSRSLSDYRGRKVLLSFYRYASCPFCNLRIHQLRQQAAVWEAKGLVMLAVFQSPAASILEYSAGETVEFPIIPDPEMTLYKTYGVESSWLAFAKSGLRAADIAKATAKGFLPGKVEGDMNRVPADFLIDEAGIIRTAFYGKDIGDHLATAAVEAFIAG
ncbi:peroxiredoxin [Fluviicoccus keumensis]|uniref:Peroxiredoxin n=1 Tax=Fluviicoccus keumensis TaxID=1435465 RepID=A0A4Q7YM78_9GAMM|nr:peroxiredoxin-like family protein [Fluviicoccus keumensis]RZU38677.1 peroxiredoxin [Fluviicoccus keumensis]